MRDTVGWIDYIPDGWNIMKFRQLITRISTGLNPRDNFKLTKDDNLYYVTIRNFKDGKLYLDDKCDRISDESWKIIQERSDLHKGDILFASISKDGQAYLLKEEPANWNVNESVFCIRVNKEYMDARYFTYEITSTRYYDDLRMDATGTTFKSIKQNNLKQSRLLVPPISEQQAIADYLDEKCSKIDEIIAESKASIEDYKELKQSVIFEAVTKGLDKNAEMKNSSIEGMGLIPEKWSIVRFMKTNYVRARLGWKGLKAEEYVDTGYPFLSAYHIVNNHLSWENLNYITAERYDESPEIKLSIGDLLLVKDGAGIGKCARIDDMPLGEATVNSSLSVITPNKSLDYRYVYYYFLSPLFQNIITRLKNGMGVPHLTQESMKDIYLPLPTKIEQEEIADFLDKKTSEIDFLISEKQSLILDLETYKKSLIYEVVTGKRRVV